MRMTVKKASAEHIQALYSVDVILPGSGSKLQHLVTTLASIPGRQLINSPIAHQETKFNCILSLQKQNINSKLMRNFILISLLLLITHSGYSQSKRIVGSWIVRDSIEAMQFFTKADGTIQERRGLANENIWDKSQRIGKYIFSDNGKLIITWSDNSTENRKVKFEENFNAAKIKIIDKKTKKKKVYLFLRIIDEVIITDK